MNCRWAGGVFAEGSVCKVAQDSRCSGADVTHPTPGSDMPSLAAVVGSLDKYNARFTARVRLQPSREEIMGVMSLATCSLAPLLNVQYELNCSESNDCGGYTVCSLHVADS